MDIKWNGKRKRLERGIDDALRRLKYAAQNQNKEAAESEAFQLYQLLDDYVEIADGIVE